MKLLCYLNTAKGNARGRMQAFAAGMGADITMNLAYQPGPVAVFWGVDQATLPLWREVQAAKAPYVYMDNGYMMAPGDGGGYFRATANAPQHSGLGQTDGTRYAALGMPQLAPWRHDGRHILVICQSDFWHERHGHHSAEQFAGDLCRSLASHSKRPVVVRKKPIHGVKEPPLAEHLKNCWAVVTHSSMAALHAVIAGVPCIALGKCALQAIGSAHLRDVETPPTPDGRMQWLGVLADNQWTLPEIKAGAPRAALFNTLGGRP